MSDVGLTIPPDLLDQVADLVAAKVLQRMAAPSPATRSNCVALTKAEAAEALGVSVDHLERHVLPDVKVVRSGRLRLIPVAELEAYVERKAARHGDWR